ncbi:hypothetical protein J5F27_14185 [Schleiferilactobacillus harbinensis]|uniref:hypothetical protein n=1 Tax=Schleiferilactobacillus harbinensis TaxID=304207 RepID=UPI001AAE3FFF|nr:hypothetical protein [Schleiferilactobacillus harbinensis]MBO3093056.1 hypothetical protein [Schleiferilactobacillus harbinensis]
MLLATRIEQIYLKLVKGYPQNGKWRFTNGAGQFFAAMADADFLHDFDKRQSNKVLRVEMKVTQRLTADNYLQNECVVLKVLAHGKSLAFGTQF